MRLNFEFNDAVIESLNALKQKTGAASMKDLFNNAFTMLEWAVDETAKGNEIAATTPDGKPQRVFVTPLLRQVKATLDPMPEASVRAAKEGRSLPVQFNPEKRAQGVADTVRATEVGQDAARVSDVARSENPKKAAH